MTHTQIATPANTTYITKPPVHTTVAPMLPIALGLIAGIIIDNLLHAPMAVSVTLATLALILPSAASRIPGRMQPTASNVAYDFVRRRRGTIAICLCAAALGMLRHALADRFLPREHVANFVGDESIIATITGRVVSSPRIIEPDPLAPRAYLRPASTRCLLEADAIDDESPGSAAGRISLTIREPHLLLREGDRIRVTGWLYRIRPPLNPGAYDWAKHHRRDGVYVGLSTDHAAAVHIMGDADTSALSRGLAALRTRLRGYLVESAFPDDDESAGVVAAMVLGRRGDVSDALNDAFLRTGNVHFLAASGMHVAWLALVGWAVAFVCGLDYRKTALLVAALILAFVVVAEPRPSILRAGIVGLLACATIYARGFLSHVNALSVAAVLILMIDPTDGFRPAFQLTFLATLGLLHFFPLVSNAIAAMWLRLGRPGIARLFHVAYGDESDNIGAQLAIEAPVLLPNRPSRLDHLKTAGYRISNLAALSFSLSLSEWLITAPLGCYYFNTFAPWGSIGTFLVAPFAMLTASIGFITLLAGLILPSTGVLLGPLLDAVAGFMIGFVRLLADLPGALLDGRTPPLGWTVAIYGLIALWGYGPKAWLKKWRRYYYIAAALLAAFWLCWPYAKNVSDGGLRVWMLAVGDGTATVVELPNGKTVIYDFGTRSSLNPVSVADDFFRDRGIYDIEAAFVSHGDFDHFSAIEGIATKTPIHRVIINDQYIPLAGEKSAAAMFLSTMQKANIPVEITSGATTFDLCPGVLIESIWPPARDQRPAPTDNDSSTVLKIEYQGRSILLTGDIAEWAQGWLLSDWTTTQNGTANGAAAGEAGFAHSGTSGSRIADVLAIPHHGSVVANTQAFIDTVNPAVAVRSTGQRRALTINDIEKLAGRERLYFTTADDGCIVITIRNGEITARRAMK